MGENHWEFELEGLEDQESTSTSLENVAKTAPNPKFNHSPARERTLKVANSPDKRLVGRPKKDITELLTDFLGKTGKPLKWEYVRCQVIRNFKKCVRWILANKGPPRKGIFQMDLWDGEMKQIWEGLGNFVWEKAALFAALGATAEGPATDGKGKRHGRKVPEFRSFNDNYCRQLYRQEEVRQAHCLYIQLVFGLHSVDPERLSRKLHVYCCGGQHNEHCEGIWTKLRDYVMREMIEKLGYKAYIMEEAFQATFFGVEDMELPNPDFDSLG